jgi:N-acetylglucosaminyl-diphospho-decaprenol L-rhamnosyltransferase
MAVIVDEIVCKDDIEISVSVVSHAQIALIFNLLKDLERFCRKSRIEVILTLNLDEELPFSPNHFSWPVRIIRNDVPIGFGANHNQAFERSAGRYFCVVNPDIRLVANPFPGLIDCFEKAEVGVAAPVVLDGDGLVEDSSRRFPTPLGIAHKTVQRHNPPDYVVLGEVIYPDWVGGMFMIYPSGVFRAIEGFDERYFMYYEDVDICARLWLRGYQVAVCPKVEVTHHAQRASHKSFRYLRWHLESMGRFFLSPVYRQLRKRAKQ